MKMIIVLIFSSISLIGFAQKESFHYAVDKYPLYKNSETYEESFKLLGEHLSSCGLNISENGSIFIQFVVSTEGYISETFLLRGVDKELYEKAVICLKKSEKWITAEHEGVKVACAINISIE